jgi:hypothetical protein
MRINLGPDVAQLRAKLMQEALDKLQAKLTPTLPSLNGALAAELGVDQGLTRGANAHVTGEWNDYQKKMMAALDAGSLHDAHDEFLKLEGL